MEDKQSGETPVTGGKSQDDATRSSSAEGHTDKALLDRYLQELAQKINKAKRYPRKARRKHWEGTVMVEIEILPSGKIHHITLRKTSQYTTLDNAALKAIKDVQPLPPFPEGLQNPSIKVTIPIQFRLKNR